MTKEQLIRKQEELRAALNRLDEYLECDDCGLMFHPDDLGEDTAWSTLCKSCDQGEQK